MLIKLKVGPFENLERGTSCFAMRFVFHGRGFECVQNQVLNAFGKSAQCTKSGTCRRGLWSDEKNLPL